MVTRVIQFTQVCKKCKEQGGAGNIFNLHQICLPISADSLKTPPNLWRNRYRTAKTSKILIPAMSKNTDDSWLPYTRPKDDTDIVTLTSFSSITEEWIMKKIPGHHYPPDEEIK